MGPLFALGLIAILGSLSVAILFVVAKFFMTFRYAALTAVLTTIAGAIGFVLALLVQTPFYPRDLGSSGLVILYLAIGLGAALVAAALTANAVWHRAKTELKNATGR